MTAAASTPIYDVCVAGAGPAGATCAHDLARRGVRVVLLDKKEFPRDKFCGNAVAPRAQRHLRRMGVLQELIDHGEAHFAASGGFVSPGGVECLSDSGKNPSGQMMACKRLHMDARVVRAAQRAGAELRDGVEVRQATLERDRWRIEAGGETLLARVLVCADGAHSQLARSLGVVRRPPEAICSRAFIEPGSHHFEYDGVVYMPEEMLPGYAAVFRHPGDELNFCTYVIPGGRYGTHDLAAAHEALLHRDPHLVRHVGTGVRIEKMKGAWLRLGGEAQTFGDRLVLVGDAAGHIDPLTGEGIQYAMDGAELAARTILEALERGGPSAGRLSRYQARWWRCFGVEFRIARAARELMLRFPAVVDAMAEATIEEGDDFFLAWTDVMCGSRSWAGFARPSLALPILRKVLGRIASRSGR